MHIELVVFDLAGTTLEDDGEVERAFVEAVGTTGVEVTAEEVAAVMGWAKRDAIRTLLERRRGSAPNDAEVERIHELFEARLVRHYATAPGVREVEGASTLFERLRGNGIHVAIETGFPKVIALVALARLGWVVGQTIDTLVTSDDVARGRPDPEGIRVAMQRVGVTDPQRVVKVGDTPSDLHEGSRACCRWVVGVTRGTHTLAQLLDHPHTHLIQTIKSLVDDVPGLSRRAPPVRTVA
jgi:phosphonatase-like hydrolase